MAIADSTSRSNRRLSIASARRVSDLAFFVGLNMTKLVGGKLKTDNESRRVM